ncbi:hypothetical protein E2562_024445 [Oryza meyeriana var. granulata]|uniref:BPM/SPOP BACK domain-containing protein n=1 Tax=Oryza meyeriana var. granulata TaxID=110450 RepID=A0A6G1EYN4_9ORYZ|nr:hypothetical protein E2562_024445 [Oryza meyeriana var. granulata]
MRHGPASACVIERLRLLCEAKLCLCKYIEGPNVATVLILAEQHECSGLKNACFEFLERPGNMAAAMATQEYDYLKRNYHSVADEDPVTYLGIEEGER